jgi:cytochrome P450
VTAPELYYDQYRYDIDDNPHEIWKRLRDEAPVWRNEKYNYWALSRFDDVQKASEDWQTFSSAHGTVLEMMSEEPGQTTLMINNDPPYHSQLRKVVARRFYPANIAKFERELRDIVIGHIKPIEDRAQFDFVQDFARWIPMDGISMLLGIPAEDRRQINQWADDSLFRAEGDETTTERGLAAMGQVHKYFRSILADRKANPQDDFLSDIANGEVDLPDGSKRPMSDRESFEFMVLLSLAGNETVARLLSNAGVLLAQYPDQREKLRENPALIPRAIEELLRFEPPSPIQFRRLTRDIVMHGVKMQKGDNVALLTASATRDERQWENPQVFDVEREPRRHVTFGYGVHSCVGANLARLESRIALEEVLARIGDWMVDESRLVRTRTSTVRGYSHVPVKILPR